MSTLRTSGFCTVAAHLSLEDVGSGLVIAKLFAVKICSSREAYNYLFKLLTSDVEEFWITALRPDKSVIRSACLFRGTVDNCPVHPRDVFRFACIENASGIIVSHNHPSHDPRPSLEDQRVTRQIQRAGKLLCIPLLDHIIVTKLGYWSFADRRIYTHRNSLLVPAPDSRAL